MWQEISINKWEDFDSIVNILPSQNWIYRGQNNAQWLVTSSLYREYKRLELLYGVQGINVKAEVNKIERAMLNEFESSYHLYLKHEPGFNNANDNFTHLLRKFECWAIMQHYGAPTRLIDWSTSPYIALFFALDGAIDDFAIYALNTGRLTLFDTSRFLEKNDFWKRHIKTNTQEPFITIFRPTVKTVRLRHQQGTFLLPNYNIMTLDEILSTYGIKNGSLANEIIAYKLVFSKSLILPLLKKLQWMGITHEHIYQGMDGFTKSLKWIMLADNYVTINENR